ncbi:MAG: biotin transporter BioY [Planctomycetes bacterium]|nr:biotin transporter BioY [Planctomycetota bacterium]
MAGTTNDNLAVKGKLQVGARHAPATDRPLVVAAGVVSGAIAIALAAQVRIPIQGSTVPFTLQTCAVLMCGYCLRPRPAMCAVALYLLVGLASSAMFATATGLWGHTGGYLFGFLLAAPVVSIVAGGVRGSLVRQILAGVMGMGIIFGMGVSWKAIVSGLGIGAALSDGLVPFLLPAGVKLALAVSAARLMGLAASSSKRGWFGPAGGSGYDSPD